MSDTRSTHKIALVGLGYVGLPTALSLLNQGVSVIGYDVSERRLAAIRSGDVDLIESDQTRLIRLVDSPRFVMTTNPTALKDADVILICVPTPVEDHHVPDLRAIRSACQTVAENAQVGQTIVLTSTTYVGCTNDLLVKPLNNRGFTVGEDIYVAFSPERIDPGNTTNVQETVPRVIGGYTGNCATSAAALIQLVAPEVHLVSSLEAAELTKIYENAFRAINIAFVNELAKIARALGIDITEVIAAASTKPYGFMPFMPGPGVGGHCIPCDPHYLLWQLPTVDVSAPVIQAAMAAIADRPHIVVNAVNQALADNGLPINNARICVIGVAFKPNVADTRETPATHIIAELINMGANVSYFDPMVPEFTVNGRPIMHATADPNNHDIIVVLNTHDGFDYVWLKSHPLVVDASYRQAGIKHRILP